MKRLSPPIDRIFKEEKIKNNPLANLSKRTRNRTKKLLLAAAALGVGGVLGGIHFLSRAEKNTLIACQQMAKAEALDKAKYEPIFLQEDGPRFGLASRHYISSFPKPFHKLNPKFANLVAEYCNTRYAWDSTPELAKAVTAQDVRKAIESLKVSIKPSKSLLAASNAISLFSDTSANKSVSSTLSLSSPTPSPPDSASHSTNPSNPPRFRQTLSPFHTP